MTEAELIELVKSHEILWAQTHPDYYNKHEREIVWREIQIKLGPNADFNARCRWTRLRQSHAKAIQRMNSKTPTAFGASIRHQWKFLDAMSFLLPLKLPQRAAPRAPTSSVPTVHQTSELPIEIIDDDIDTDLSFSSNVKCEAEAFDGGLGFDKLEAEPWDGLEEPKMKKWRANEDEPEDASENAFDAAKDIPAGPSESPRMGFFRSILPMVDELSSSDFLKFQMKVLHSLMEVRAETLPQNFQPQAMTFPGSSAVNPSVKPPVIPSQMRYCSPNFPTPDFHNSPAT